MRSESMQLKIWLPTDLLLEEDISRLKAEAENGWFGLLPRHVDFVTSLVPGVIEIQPSGKAQEYIAVDRGILVKRGPEVLISTRNAIRGASLAELKSAVEKQFLDRAERERAARAFEAKLEADLVRGLLEVERHG